MMGSPEYIGYDGPSTFRLLVLRTLDDLGSAFSPIEFDTRLMYLSALCKWITDKDNDFNEEWERLGLMEKPQGMLPKTWARELRYRQLAAICHSLSRNGILAATDVPDDFSGLDEPIQGGPNATTDKR